MAKPLYPILLYPHLSIEQKLILLMQRPTHIWQLISSLLLSLIISITGTLLIWRNWEWLGFLLLLAPSMAIPIVWIEWAFRPTEYRKLLLHVRPRRLGSRLGNNENQGFAEVSKTSRFPGLLTQAFPKKIFSLRKLGIYTPDFCYIDSDQNLHIDIEIDEPYTPRQYPKLQPRQEFKATHYIGLDDRRNAFFREAGWFVVRFSERQVLLYPEGCVQYLVQLVMDLTVGLGANVMGLRNLEKEFKEFPRLPPEPQWTKSEALAMAESRARLSYIP